MAKRILRPLDFAGLLDETFHIYKEHFLLIVGIYAVVQLPVYLFNNWLNATHVYRHGRMTTTGFAWMAAQVIPFVIMYAANFRAVSNIILGKETGILDSYRSVFPRLVPLVLTYLLHLLVVCVGFAMCLVPGVILGVWLAYTSPVLILEGAAYLGAFKRSKFLTKGQGNRIFAVFVLWWFSMIVPALGLTLVGNFIKMGRITLMAYPPENAVILVLKEAWLLLIGPMMTTALTLMYYDSRVRKEGFDIKILAEELEAGLNPS